VTNAYYEAKEQLNSHIDELTKVMGFDPKDKPFSFEEESLEVVGLPDLEGKIKAAQVLFQEKNILQDNFVFQQEVIMQRLFPEKEVLHWIGVADACRPDIALSLVFEKIAQEKVQKHKGEYLPTLAVVGGYGGGPTPYVTQPTTSFQSEIMQWAIGISLNWTLFDGTGREQRIRAAKREVTIASLDTKKIVQAAHTDVGVQIYAVESALSKYLSLTAHLALARQTLTQLMDQFEIGYVTIYDALISVNGFITAKTAYDAGQYDLLVSYYTLLHSSGKVDL
jgi:outer membrane protein TolC